MYGDRVNPYSDRNVYGGRNPYDNRNPYEDNRYNDQNQNRYNDGRPYDPRNQFNDDRANRYNGDRPFDPQNPPNQQFPNQFNNDYDDRNRQTYREYEQQRLELERRNRLEDANLRRILDDVDKLASSECSINVGAQWNFETNVNEATQQESVRHMCCFYGIPAILELLTFKRNVLKTQQQQVENNNCAKLFQIFCVIFGCVNNFMELFFLH